MEGLERPFTIRILLAAAVAAVFGASLAGSFHFDDYSIFADPVLTSSSGWWEVWEPMRTRPFTYFTFWLNHQLGGTNPAGYHAVNLAIHLATVLLLFGVLRRLIPPRAAILATALFALHPIQAEPVAYIFARATLLMTLFCVLSFRFWIDGRRWVAVATFAVALLAKEECVAFPLALLICWYATRRDRADLPPIAAMLTLSLAAGAHVMWVLASIPDSAAGAGAAVTPLDYFSAQGLVILRYFRLLVVPYGFTIDPDIAIPTVLLAVLAWLAVGALALLAVRRLRNKPAGLWILAGILLLLPSSSIFPANDLAADRRMYLPLAAFAVAAALLLRSVKPYVLAAAVVILAVLSAGRVMVWHSEESLWREAVERSPSKLRPKVQLARVVGDGEALTLLEEARAAAPDNSLVASELGRKYLALGRTSDALREFGRALALDPASALAHNNRGVALLSLGQRDVARQDFERALELDPCLFDPRHNLRQMGVLTEAPADCRLPGEQERLLGR